MGNFDGLFSKVLTLFSVQPIAHLAWMQLGVNFGMFVVHISVLAALGISLKSLLTAPSRLDKVMFGLSLLIVLGLVFLWFAKGSYPVLFNTRELLMN